MKKKILSVLFALVLAVSLILVPATVSTAATVDYNAAVIKAADRLVEMQNGDGGFAWQVDPGATTGPGTSTTNTLGITAIGILKAHGLEGKATYEVALAKAYGFADATPECKRFPDVTFLIGLAGEASDDASLLAALQNEVAGTTVQSILDLAKARWDTRLADLGGTPVAMAEFLMGPANRPGKLAFWDLEAAVKAALALEPYFAGYEAQALAIAGVMNDNLQLGSTYYFDIEDASIVCYTLALGGAIEAFSELGVYPTVTRTMTDLLIAYQDGAGYWDQGDDLDADEESVQTTAYAVMALVAQGDADALIAAQSGSDWLVSTQNLNGGWFPGYVYPTKPPTLENLEVDSEAAWALAVISVGSTSVDMTASYIPPVEKIGISVTPPSVSFGAVTPSAPSGPKTVTVTNTGNVDEYFSAMIINESPADVYTGDPGLTMDGNPIATWGVGPVVPADTDTPELILTVPGGTAPGTYTATLVFWAEEYTP